MPGARDPSPGRDGQSRQVALGPRTRRNLIARATYGMDTKDKRGKVKEGLGDLAAQTYIFDRLEGRPAQELNVKRNTNLNIEFRSFEEVKVGLLEQGIDVDRLPLLSDLRDDKTDA